uniref:GntR-family protein transcriptional regulator n=1 Tax=Podoviridae sp. ctrub15 TaxID=2826581 RepID=A0A8S5LUR4_9CAUD|nr:MAG TPA: GntR-family protein transcriptional regulator [Podoviridae sp. ctrub15]
MTLYSIGIVAKHYGVSPSTIRRRLHESHHRHRLRS